MANEQAPAGWIGSQVGIQYWDGEKKQYIGCELRAVSDRGVIAGWGEEENESARFYPWHAVLHIDLVKARPSTPSRPPRTWGRGTGQ